MLLVVLLLTLVRAQPPATLLVVSKFQAEFDNFGTGRFVLISGMHRSGGAAPIVALWPFFFSARSALFNC